MRESGWQSTPADSPARGPTRHVQGPEPLAKKSMANVGSETRGGLSVMDALLEEQGPNR